MKIKKIMGKSESIIYLSEKHTRKHNERYIQDI